MENSSLPATWSLVPVSSVCDIVRGVTFKKAASIDKPAKGYLPVLRANGIQDGQIVLEDLVYVPEEMIAERQLIREGDVVIAMSSGSKALVGKAARSDKNIEAGFGAFCGILRPSQELDSKYFGHFFQSKEYRNSVSALSAGVNINNLKPAHFRDIQLPVAPREEQTRIANKLDELLAQVDTIKTRVDAIPDILKRFRQSVLAAAVSGRLTEEWRIRNKVSESVEALQKRVTDERLKCWGVECERVGRNRKYKTPVEGNEADLPAIPAGWKWMPVDALATKVVDGVHKKPVYQDSGVPFVTVKNLTAGPGISFENLNYVSEEDHAEFFKRANPEYGDILISKDGTLGVVRQIKTDQVFSIFVSVALVKPVLREMSDYLEIAFSSPVLQNQMIGVGTGLQHIHLTDLRKDMIPVPPIEEQEEIVRISRTFLEVAEQIERRVASAQSGIHSITQSILAKAFCGELLPQHSDDESASVLLERIQDA